MDQITQITRRGGVATVRLLSGDELRIPSAVYLERRLRTGEKIDPEAYRAFMAQRGYPHALEAAMKFLALRERSEKEVVSRLRRSCYDAETIARVMETLTRHALVSDGRFAEQWTDSRKKKYGRDRIARELRMKGVSESEARTALADFSGEEEFERAYGQAVKMTRKFRGDAKKIAQALLRRGYGWSVARKAAEAAVKAAGPEAGS
ncbi:MAG: regulatory protein RecX [Clostridia bacterium]|nr:regulatory protein RecX [Clostridia bacterium]